MKNGWRNVCWVLGTVLLAWSVLVAPAAAQKGPRAKNGFYIGGYYASLSLGGGLNGEDVLYDAEELIVIPKLRPGSGFGIIFGRRTGNAAVEIIYQQTKNDAEWLGAIGESMNHVIDLNMKYFMFGKSIVQPFLLLGLGGEWFSVPGGSATLDGLTSGDSSYRGFTFTPGGGLAFYPIPRLALSVGAGYRFMLVGKVRGVMGTFKSLEDSVIGSGPNLTAGITLTF